MPAPHVQYQHRRSQKSSERACQHDKAYIPTANPGSAIPPSRQRWRYLFQGQMRSTARGIFLKLVNRRMRDKQRTSHLMSNSNERQTSFLSKTFKSQ